MPSGVYGAVECPPTGSTAVLVHGIDRRSHVEKPVAISA